MQDIKAATTAPPKTLTREDFQSCFRRWQGRWDTCVPREGSILRGIHGHVSCPEINFLRVNMHHISYHTLSLEFCTSCYQNFCPGLLQPQEQDRAVAPPCSHCLDTQNTGPHDVYLVPTRHTGQRDDTCRNSAHVVTSVAPAPFLPWLADPLPGVPVWFALWERTCGE